MKRVLLIVVMLLLLCSSAFANAVIVINDIPAKVIRNQIIVGMAANQGQYILEDQTENILKFVCTKDVNNLLFMGFTKDTVTYTITPSGKNTVVSLSENVLIYRSNGALYSSQVPNNQAFLNKLLIELKSYYNGSYRFGFDLTEKYKDGYKIKVFPNSACEEAGLKTGDVVLSVNNILTKKIPKKDMNNVYFVDMFNSTPATFVILKDGVKKTLTITPKFFAPLYKPEVEQ